MRLCVYRIEWHREAAKQFRDIVSVSVRNEILNVIEQDIAVNPLVGKPLACPFAGLRSFRIGTLRILFKAYKDRLVIVILRIEHRKNVYRA